jgi:tRNA (guanine-N7-)-methyltransferase
MPRKKLQKIEALHHLDNVIEINDPNLKNKLANFFGHNKKITLELGCGKAEYTLALAQEYPQEKFIGIDIQGERLWHGASEALNKRLDNVLFLRMPVENIAAFLPKHSIKEIWLTFPDPQSKKGKIKKRLSSPRFLKIYKNILSVNGLINLKTDNYNLFVYSQESIKEQGGKILTANSINLDENTETKLKITTTYENIYRKQNKDIYYLKASL